MSATISDTVRFAKAISDDTRQRIMDELCCEWLSVGDLVERMGDVSQPTVSHHLRILNEAGLLHRKKEGQQVISSLDQSRIVECCGDLLVSFAPDLPQDLKEKFNVG